MEHLTEIPNFPKGHCPESLFSRRDIVPNSHFPEGTFSRIPLSRRDIVPNSYFPKALFSGNNYSSSSFLWERFNHHCSQERLFHHHRSFENDFSIVLGEQFSHTIRYWLRCCKKIDGLRIGILSRRENGDSGYYPFGKMEIRDNIPSGKWRFGI